VVVDSQPVCHSCSVQSRPPAAAQAASASGWVRLVHGWRFGLEHAVWLIEPVEKLVASGREASYAIM